MVLVMIVVIVSSFTIMVFVIMLVFVASLDFGYLVYLPLSNHAPLQEGQ